MRRHSDPLMSLTVHHYTASNIDKESLLCTARRLAFEGKWLTPPFRRTLRLNFDAQWEYAIPPPVFDAGNCIHGSLRDWGDLEEDGNEGRGLEELEEWIPLSREGLRPSAQEYGDLEMDEADTGFIVADDDEEQLHGPSTRPFLNAGFSFIALNDGSDGGSKHHRTSPSTSTNAYLEDEVDTSFIRGAVQEEFNEADTGFHVDEDEIEEDMSFGFILSGGSGVSYNWGDDKQVDQDKMNTAFFEHQGPSAEDDEEDEAGVESNLLSLSQDSKAKDLNLSRRGEEDKYIFNHRSSDEADTGFHIEDENEEDAYMVSEFFLQSIDHSRVDDEANAAAAWAKNPSSIDRSLPDVPIEPPDESPDIVMMDDDEDKDANTGFIDFKAALGTDEEDEEEDIDSRFILSDADIQYHNGFISEIQDADDFTVQEVKEEEEEMEKHVEGEYEEDRISEWANSVNEDDTKVHGSENGDYEYKGHPSRLIPIVRCLSVLLCLPLITFMSQPQTIISKLFTSPVHTPQRFLKKYQSLSACVEPLGSGLGWIIPVTTPGGVVLTDGHEAPGFWTPRSLAAFWSFLAGTLHEETGMGVAYDYFGGNGYFFKLYHDSRLSVLLRGRLDEWVWRNGDEEEDVKMFESLRLLLLDSVNKEVGFW
ncbi:hypothetical protein DFS33DRAFT_959678 [Desarmillaria ectypa]|nr:hypothetical protein DFS33DRAFT_959678 [Desarmillaria ectypa]